MPIVHTRPLLPRLGSRGYRPDEVNHTTIRAWLRGFDLPLPRCGDFSSLQPELLGACEGKEPTMILGHNSQSQYPASSPTIFQFHGARYSIAGTSPGASKVIGRTARSAYCVGRVTIESECETERVSVLPYSIGVSSLAQLLYRCHVHRHGCARLSYNPVESS